MREAMHPAEAFKAFSALAAEGTRMADIAVEFGRTENKVARRLALARVSPVLMTVYRGGDLTLEQLSAFTITDDHGEQDRVWSKLNSWSRDPTNIHRSLSEQTTG